MTDVAQRRQRGIQLQRELAEPTLRIAVLGSFNLDLIPPFLIEALDRVGIVARAHTGDFGQIAAQTLNPSSELYASQPSDVLVVPAAEDLLAPMYAQGAVDDPEALVEDRLGELESAVSAVLERLPGATCYVVAFGSHRAPLPHVLDPTAVSRGQRALLRFLEGVRELSNLSPRLVVVDFDFHVHRSGMRDLTDARLWYLGRMRLNPHGLAELSDLVARHAAAFRGAARKVAVVDLDDTLWGGVLGEVGIGGIDLGREGVGLAFQEFQAALVRLRRSGVVLAVASKNDRREAVEAVESHPEMVLRPSDFAAERINWTDKATSLTEIADELGLGLDSFVFFDDNPVEREWVTQALPEVAVPVLPPDPAHRPDFLRETHLFDRLTLTDADVTRAESYAAQGRRTRLRAGSMSFEDFLSSLDQQVAFEPVTEATLARAAQLCQRTNQFNLTARRHTPTDIERMMTSGIHELFTIRVRDRFGDNGITGLAILELDGAEARIDTLLLSCRVLGRCVEDALLAFLADRARSAGATRLVGRYEPTERNGQVLTFLSNRKLLKEGAHDFVLELAAREIPMPQEMDVRVGVDA